MPLTVLLVDDHAGFRRAARRLLEAAGYVVVGEAASAAEAIGLAADLSPDAVLLDVMLPDGDGFDVATELRRSDPRPIVVLVSSRRASAYSDRLPGAAGAAFVAKDDLSPQVLAEVLRS